MTDDSPTPRCLTRAPIKVRWGDLDAFNHVNNATFLSYLEEARVSWLSGLPGIRLDDRIGPVLANSNVNYRRPVLWPNDLVVELFVERVGNSSLTMGHRLLSAADESVLYADGNVVMVWVDTATGASVPLPGAVRAACTAA
jgi:acyl-CoA thioester hydrolase